MIELLHNYKIINLKSVLAVAFLLFASTFFLSPQTVSADNHCDGLTGADYGACITDPNPPSDDAEGEVYGVVQTGINIFSVVVGIISVIMIIIGGLKYIMSSGDASNITSAKNTILYAIIGLVIVAFAQIIVLFVLDTVDGDESSLNSSLVAEHSVDHNRLSVYN